jgi:hypothetical protein
MNPILPFVPAACTSSDWSPGLYPDHMLSELLALREKMIMQLRLERLDAVIIANFLMGVIDQHEKAAALLRAQLENHQADAPTAA